MKILILGYSNFVERRVLPSLQALEEVSAIELASVSSAARVPLERKVEKTYSAYDAALDESDARVVYVSLVNALHDTWTRTALEKGFHVIVDKPSLSSLAVAEELCALSDEKGVSLSEATVYAYHPQIRKVRDLVAKSAGGPIYVSMAFSFPPLPPGNYRYVKELGGGALSDLGPYAMSPGRLFFGTNPGKVVATIRNRSDHGEVDTSFCFMATYPGKGTLTGECGFDTEYCNRLQVLGPDFSLRLDRVFTIPSEMENTITYQSRNKVSELPTEKGDSIALFFKEVLTGIERNSYAGFKADLLSDAKAMDMLLEAANADVN